MSKEQPFFLRDEVTLLHLVAMCQESFTPDLWEKMEELCRLLVSIRTAGLRPDAMERIEKYLLGAK